MDSGHLIGATLIAVCMAVTACDSSDHASCDSLLDGSYPLRIGAITVSSGNGGTRVSEKADGTASVWTDGDKINVKIGSDGEVGTYKYDGSNFVAEPPCYWQSTAAQDITAWYPADETVTLADQSDGLAYVLKATAEDVEFNTTPSLAFAHQLAKVRVRIVNGSGKVEKVEVKSCESCTNSEGNVTGGNTEGWVTMHHDENNDVWEACVMPTDDVPTEFIRVNGNTVVSTPQITKLEAGKVYAHTVIVNPTVIDLNQSNGHVLVKGGAGTLVLNGTCEDFKIDVIGGSNPTIVFDNVTINTSNANIISGTSYTLILVGENRVSSSGSPITVSEENTLTIDGEGSLTATSTGRGAGIGGGEYHSGCGDIIIKGGTITAVGGEYGAGIGGGFLRSDCGNIIISGGKITAVGGEYGAGIGGGEAKSGCSNIIISGGTITATGGSEGGAGIGGGSGFSDCGNITISDCSITAEGGLDSESIGEGYESSCGTVRISNTTVNGEYIESEEWE